MNLEALTRALLYISTVLLVGMPVGLWYVGRPRVPAQPFLVALGEGGALLRAAAALCGLAAAGLLAAQVAPLELDWSTADTWRSLFSEAVFGQMALARMGLSLTLLLALFLIRDARIRFVIAPVVGLLLYLSILRTSHTAAMEGAWRDLLANYLHLLGGALWTGGLIALVLCSDAIADAADANAAPAVMERLIERFSPFGMMGVALVSGSGLLVTATHVLSLDVFWEPGYGRMLLFKLLAVGLAVLFAGYHKFAAARSMHGMEDVHRFRRTLWIELLVVMFVFYIAALLATQSMPGGDHGHDPATLPALGGYTLPVWMELATLGVGVLSLFAAALDLRARQRD
jgi:putative copper export protein